MSVLLGNGSDREKPCAWLCKAAPPKMMKMGFSSHLLAGSTVAVESLQLADLIVVVYSYWMLISRS